MGSNMIERYDHNNMEEIENDHMGGKQSKKAVEWVLSSPKPPTVWSELMGLIRGAFMPNGEGTSTSAKLQRQSSLKRIYHVLKCVFPIMNWVQDYNRNKFKRDIMAGLTLASLSIPQGIGYANLASLDPQYGLYTSAVPPLIYAIMGSSREIAIGPVAVVSLLLSSMVRKVVDPSTNPVAYRHLVFTVTFFAGIFQLTFGLFRLGFLIDLLSHAAIVGFMGGAAIVIGLQQLKGLLGLDHFTNKTDIVSVLEAVYNSLHGNYWGPLNFIFGCAFLIFILLARYLGMKKKKLFWVAAIAPLVSVILSTLLVYVTRADKHGVKILKHFPRGINPSSVHQLQLTSPHLGQAVKIGLIAALIALTEAMAVGRSFASMNGYHLDGNKEMVSMGFMNIAGSLSSCYVATGSFSRTAVNYSAGCQTAMSNIVMAITVIVSLEALTGLLYYTPNAILASIIIAALPGLIHISEAANIWRVDKFDFLICLGAFFGVLFATVEIGLLTAIVISFLRIIMKSIRPSVYLLGRMQGTNTFSSIEQYPVLAIKTPGVLIVGIGSDFLCFTNASSIRERIIEWAKAGEKAGTKEMKEESTHAVIIDMSHVTNIDTSGVLALEELHKKLTSHRLKLAIANPRWHVIHKLKVANFANRIGEEWIFLTVEEALKACIGSEEELHEMV